MASILIRGLDDAVKSRLAEQAARNGRSMEAEAREILAHGVAPVNIGLALFAAGQKVGGFDELPIPPRSDYPRGAELE